MNQNIASCPYCGAELKKQAANQPQNCAYCGASVQSTASQQAQSQPRPVSSPLVQAADPAGKQPFDYCQLERPKPTTPLQGAGCSLVFGLFWTIFSAIFIVIGVGVFIKESTTHNWLSKEGIVTQATITRLEEDDSGDSTSYYVYYQFIDLYGDSPIQVEGSDGISYGLYSALEYGQEIEIVYAASDPGISAVTVEFGPPNLLFPFIFTGMGLLFTLFGVILTYTALKALWYLLRLRSESRQVQGILFDRWQSKDSDGDPTYFVAYAFEIPYRQGEQQIITHAEQNKNLYQKYQIGDALTIRYLPDKPNISQAQ